MKRSVMRKSQALIGLLAGTSLLAGCVSPTAGPSGLYAQPIGNAPVTSNPTPYSDALYCLADYARRYELPSPRMAVGRISDYTGTISADGGRQVTQGASLMANSALAKAGARLVERYDTSVSELELRYANNRLIGDAAADPQDPGFRRILAGQVPGSDFYLVGGITEVNYNIRSAGFDVAGGQVKDNGGSGLINGRIFVMNVAIDLRLVQTTTLEVVDVVSYQKQIVGREVSAGVFDFLNGNVFDVSAGSSGLEPVQLAVRALVERATVEFMSNLYGAPSPDICMNPANDPLAGRTTYAAAPTTDTTYGLERTNTADGYGSRAGRRRGE